MRNFEGRAVLVTGASRGIGRAVALRMAQQGAAVVVNYNGSRAAAEQLVSEITALPGGKAIAERADVGDPDQAQQLAEACLDAFGAIDVLVNNAGVTADGLAAALGADDWLRVLETNLLGAVYCSQAVIPQMMAQKSGSIVNVSSISASRPGIGQSNYAASKGGLESFTRALARELAPRGIRCNAVSPGIVVTEMSEQLREDAGADLLRAIPLRRYGLPEEIASVIAFLGSEDSSYLTGQIIHVNGGLA